MLVELIKEVHVVQEQINVQVILLQQYVKLIMLRLEILVHNVQQRV